MLIHIQALVGLHAQDSQIHGPQTQLGQNTGQNGGNAAFRVEKAGYKAGNHAGQHSTQHGDPHIAAADHQHHANAAAGAERTVHRKVGNLQHTVGNIQANGHDTPDHALGYRAGQRVDQTGHKGRSSVKQNITAQTNFHHPPAQGLYSIVGGAAVYGTPISYSWVISRWVRSPQEGSGPGRRKYRGYTWG